MQKLLDVYRPLLTYLASRQLRGALRSKVGASDLVQTTVWKATQKFADEQFANRQGFHAWLLIILDHAAADLRRRFFDAQKRDVSRERSLASPEMEAWLQRLSTKISPTDAAMDAADTMQRVTAALEQLTPHYRLVLRLRYFERLSFVEIGKQIDRPSDAARMLHNRALARLKSLLTEKDDDRDGATQAP